MCDSTLEQDVLPAPGCQAEKLSVLLLPHLSDCRKEVPTEIRGDFDCVSGELLADMCPEQSGQITICMLLSWISLSNKGLNKISSASCSCVDQS